MLQHIIDTSGIPFLICLVMLYFSFRVLVLKEVNLIRGKDKRAVKEKEAYAREMGILMLLFALASFIMGLILLFNTFAAIAFIGVATIAFAYRWNKVNAKY